MSISILLVDDSPEILQVLTELFYTSKNDVHVVGKAKNHDEALEILNSTHVDIISIDIFMGHLVGFDLCRTVRRSKPHVFITMCSNDVSDASKRISESCGAHYFLEKPVGFEKIDDMLQAYNQWLAHGKVDSESLART